MNKLKTIIDLVNQGDKAKLWKYLNKGIYSKKDKIDVMKNTTTSEGSSEQSELFEYYKFNSRQWDDNSDIIDTVGSNCYEILINYDNYITMNRLAYGGYNFYALTKKDGVIFLKAFKILAIEDKSWIDEISDKITPITKSEYNTIDIDQ